MSRQSWPANSMYGRGAWRGVKYEAAYLRAAFVPSRLARTLDHIQTPTDEIIRKRAPPNGLRRGSSVNTTDRPLLGHWDQQELRPYRAKAHVSVAPLAGSQVRS